MNGSRQVDRCTVYFLAIILAYIALQIACTANVLDYLPNGFRTENFYHPLAVNLISHGVYGLGDPPELMPSTFRPPFYAFVLSLAYRIFGTQEMVGVVMNNVFLTLTFCLVYLIGRRIKPVIGLLAVVILMLDTIFLAQANRNQSDLLFCFLLTLMTCCFLNSFRSQRQFVWLIIGSVALALAVFTRAAGMYLWLPVSICLVIAFWQRLPAKRIVVLIAVVIIAEAAFVVPWKMRNHAISGNSDYTSMIGFHLTSFWGAQLLAKRLGVSPLKAKAMISEENLSDPNLPKVEDQGRYEAYMKARGQQLILDNAVYILPLLLENIPTMFLSYSSDPIVVFLSQRRFDAWKHIDDKLDKLSFGTSPWDIERRITLFRTYWDDGLIGVLGYGFIVKIVNAIVFFMAFAGVHLMYRSGSRQWRDVAWFIFLVYGCVTIISLLTTQGRFRVPVMPAFALMASFSLHYFWQKYRNNSLLRRGLGAPK